MITAEVNACGDGNRVKSVLNGVTTYYVGNHFEWTGSNSVAGAPRRIEEQHADGLSSTRIHPESGQPATDVPCDDVQGRRGHLNGALR